MWILVGLVLGVLGVGLLIHSEAWLLTGEAKSLAWLLGIGSVLASALIVHREVRSRSLSNESE